MVDGNVAEDSARNRLHPGTQSDVDGERQRLEPFKNALGNLGRRALHIEQIWRRSGLKPRSNRRTEKSADRQTAFRLYIVEDYVKFITITFILMFFKLSGMQKNILELCQESSAKTFVF